MIFLRRETFREYIRFYPVTSIMLAVMGVLFLAMEWTGSSTLNRTLVNYGAIYSWEGETHEWWRYFSAIFLHIGVSHLLFNAFALYVFAPPLERVLGTWRYAGFILFSGFAGNAVSMLWSQPPFISAGASGAIYGIYAAYLYLALFHKHVLDEGTRQTVTTVVIVGFLYSFVVPNVNLYAHAGGFAGGFLYFALWVSRFRRR
ncbi:rhomboid family intramembrane serine protease [Gorillibacterium sp. sgz5001074]|uniref:rhomboid family intramembrane serine protease n=1 Tax=Gorillibacterium sp. sgz5001074 TaxID=3446695 RepID=UPI003F66B4D8